VARFPQSLDGKRRGCLLAATLVPNGIATVPIFLGDLVMNAPHTGPAESKPKPRLLDQVRETIRVKHYRSRTEEAYIG
jgi:hypothetical protein